MATREQVKLALRRLHAKRKALRICRECKTPLPEENKVRCQDCKKKHTERENYLRPFRGKSMDLDYLLSKMPPVPCPVVRKCSCGTILRRYNPKSLCALCETKTDQTAPSNSRRWRIEHRLCIDCGIRAEWGKQRCTRHLGLRREQGERGRIRRSN